MLLRTESESQGFDDPRSNERPAAELLETLRHLEMEVEAAKSSVARTLHDEVGGLLVGAIMDIGWISQQSGHSDIVRDKLMRAIGSLRAAIDIKRKLVAALRPSLLDDVGLCSTMGWHLKASCDAAGVAYSESYPLNEPPLSADFKIAAFRIFERALRQMLSGGGSSELLLEVEIIEDTLHCRIASHLLESRATLPPEDLVATPLHHCTRQMGGTCRERKTLDQNQLHVVIPMPSAAA